MTELALSILASDDDVLYLEIHGTTEDGKPSRSVFRHGAGEHPEEIAPLVQALLDAQ